MPARVEEVHHAKDEGVHFEMLVNPVEFLGDEKGNLTAVRCIRMELGEPDASGRRSPVPVKGSEFVTPCSVAIIAAGTSANPLIQSTTPGLATTKRGYISADDSLATSKPGVFAGGDIVTGGATVILAMGAGRKAAKSIDTYLKALGQSAN
jgi:glutamate synthase (NADPH) small chain